MCFITTLNPPSYPTPSAMQSSFGGKRGEGPEEGGEGKTVKYSGCFRFPGPSLCSCIVLFVGLQISVSALFRVGLFYDRSIIRDSLSCSPSFLSWRSCVVGIIQEALCFHRKQGISQHLQCLRLCTPFSDRHCTL